MSAAAALRTQTLKIGRTGSTVVSYQEDDAQCPQCKSDKYLNPDLRLLVSPCFHKMCEQCIDMLFAAGPAPCPECHQVLRKNQFVSQIFEDLSVEKEVRIRKRVAKVFNKRPEDFPSLRLYNDYLEEVEDITFNLMNGVDVDETEARITAYEMENRDNIAENQARSMNESRYQTYQEELQKREREQRREDYLKQLEDERRQRAHEKSDLLMELANTNKSAQAILAARSSSLKRSSALRQQQQQQSPASSSASDRLSLPSWLTSAMDTDHAANDAAHARDFDAHQLIYTYPSGYTVWDDYIDPSTDYLKDNRAARAGGYAARFAHERALADAFSGLSCMTIPS
ncbi:CDK-activating kinase assembly factor MAT1-domain-containing protein [Gongronella butleri]|nr:CDK-activating kinase assembly factor MAT1-domain-containing protein [Gongronella butleri]